VHQDSATTRTQGEFAWQLGADPGSIGEARQAFITWLQEASTDEELLQDMSVVVSELASNALDGGDAEAPVAEVRADVDDGVLELVVSNRLPEDVTDIRHWDLDDPLRGGGRGLMIVRAYTDSLAVDSAGGTVSVRCTRRLHGAS
jgi:anti-sigma regulatory factor (Ser/Thr protein kinase)